MDKKCELCKKLYDVHFPLLISDYWSVFLAPDQGYLGRCYVTLRVHKESLSDLSSDEWQDFASICKKLEPATAKAFGAMPFNWTCLMNNAYQSVDATPHVHWHFRPRYKHPVSVSAHEFYDPAYGYHYDREQRDYVDESILLEIQNMILVQLAT